MLTDAATIYGKPAIADLLQLILENPNVDQNMCLSNLQQWMQSVVTIQTQKHANFVQVFF